MTDETDDVALTEWTERMVRRALRAEAERVADRVLREAQGLGVPRAPVALTEWTDERVHQDRLERWARLGMPVLPVPVARRASAGRRASLGLRAILERLGNR